MYLYKHLIVYFLQMEMQNQIKIAQNLICNPVFGLWFLLYSHNFHIYLKCNDVLFRLQMLFFKSTSVLRENGHCNIFKWIIY